MMFGFKKEKPTQLRDWDIVTLYLLDNIMEFENYFERQKQFDHTEWKDFDRLPSYLYDRLKVFKESFIKMYSMI